MILLVTHAHPTIVRAAHPNLGRLVQPRHYSSIAATAHAGIPWAADNDAFVSFNEKRFRAMLAALRGLPGCLFVAAPDVVGDDEATAELFETWQPEIAPLPVALVAQDGLEARHAPWDKIDALFIGGTTDYKMSKTAAAVVREAKRRGKWAHMGRVNSLSRARYANSIGCDSIDGTKWARWTKTWLPRGLVVASAPQQLPIEDACH